MKYVFISEARSLTEAQVVASYLEAHGFHPQIKDLNTRQLAPHFETFLGKISIEVPEAEAIEASLCIENLERAKSEQKKNYLKDRDPDEEEVLLASSQANARRAMLCALFGLIFIPILLNFYSMMLSFRVMRTERPVSSKSWKYLLYGAVFNLIAFGFWFNFGLRWLLNIYS